ncbi:symporter small accessory protein [Sporomusa malonica]
MLGLSDPWIALAYILCLASTALCIGYAAWKSRE